MQHLTDEFVLGLGRRMHGLGSGRFDHETLAVFARLAINNSLGQELRPEVLVGTAVRWIKAAEVLHEHVTADDVGGIRLLGRDTCSEQGGILLLKQVLVTPWIRCLGLVTSVSSVGHRVC